MSAAPMDLPFLTRIIKVLYRLPTTTLKGCRHFNTESIVGFETLDAYFGARGRNIFLRYSKKLPDGVLGLTLKRRVPIGDGTADRTHYYIVVREELPVAFERLFVTAHELGHVLLHPYLMEPEKVMLLQANIDLFGARSSLYGRYAEIEANLFALILLIPDRLVAASKESNGKIDISRLQMAYLRETHLYLPEAAARDRASAYLLHNDGSLEPHDWDFVLRGTPGSATGGLQWGEELRAEEEVFLEVYTPGGLVDPVELAEVDEDA